MSTRSSKKTGVKRSSSKPVLPIIRTKLAFIMPIFKKDAILVVKTPVKEQHWRPLSVEVKLGETLEIAAKQYLASLDFPGAENATFVQLGGQFEVNDEVNGSVHQYECTILGLQLESTDGVHECFRRHKRLHHWVGSPDNFRTVTSSARGSAREIVKGVCRATRHACEHGHLTWAQ